MTFFKSLFLIFLICLTSGVPSFSATNDLLVAPTRVDFLNRERTKTVNVVNRGATDATYRISFKNMAMSADGVYRDITVPESGERFADPFLRFSPRQVTLKAGQSQTVRLMLRRVANMAEGEYRSHLVFTTVPPETAGESVETVVSDSLSVQLIPVVSVSIPVFIRVGEVDHAVTMSDVSLARSDGAPKSVTLTLNRTGQGSSYGDILILSGSMVDPVVLGELRSFSVLYPYPLRRVSIPLTVPATTKTQGPLRVVYYQRQGDQRLTTIYDEKTVE